MEALKENWMLFSEYCRMRGIVPNGNHIRTLDKLDNEFKTDVTPSSASKTWAVQTIEADKIFCKEV